jgi:hypothetical protein
MSLTLGTGPLAAQRRGRFDRGTSIDDAAMYLEPLDRRVRGYLGGQLVSTRRPCDPLGEAL